MHKSDSILLTLSFLIQSSFSHSSFWWSYSIISIILSFVFNNTVYFSFILLQSPIIAIKSLSDCGQLVIQVIVHLRHLYFKVLLIHRCCWRVHWLSYVLVLNIEVLDFIINYLNLSKSLDIFLICHYIIYIIDKFSAFLLSLWIVVEKILPLCLWNDSTWTTLIIVSFVNH